MPEHASSFCSLTLKDPYSDEFNAACDAANADELLSVVIAIAGDDGIENPIMKLFRIRAIAKAAKAKLDAADAEEEDEKAINDLLAHFRELIDKLNQQRD